MKTKKNKKLKKIESFIYKSGISFCVLLLLATVFAQTALAQVNLDVQKLKDEVEAQENTNTSLAMKINEMASLENIQEVSTEEGLSYNSDNIKTIG